MIQLAVALGTVTIVSVTGIEGILGLGPAVFGPMFSGGSLTPHDLVVPWLAAAAFTAGGLLLSFGVRPDPKQLSLAYAAQQSQPIAPARPLREILRHPGVATAMVAAVGSFAVMA